MWGTFHKFSKSVMVKNESTLAFCSRGHLLSGGKRITSHAVPRTELKNLVDQIKKKLFLDVCLQICGFKALLLLWTSIWLMHIAFTNIFSTGVRVTSLFSEFVTKVFSS